MTDVRFYKLVLFINGLVPLALLVWDWWRERLGANPLDFLTRATGTLTLVFLLLTLSVTPLRKLTGVHWLIRFRRMLGLYAFFYGSLHLLTYLWFDKLFALPEIVEDVWRRPFIALGMFAFFLMVPLAVTSTNRMVKRMGGKRWARLHRLTYLSAAGGALHYYMLVKSDTTKPLIFGAVLALLLGYRLFAAYLRQSPQSLSINKGKSQ